MVVQSFRVSESTAQGGLARFTIDFAEAGEFPSPIVAEDTAALAALAAADVEAAAEAEFTESATGFGVDGQPEFVEAAALDDTNSFMDGFKDVAARAGQAAAYADDLNSELNAALTTATGVVQSITDPLAALVRFPANLAAGIMGGIGRLRAIANDPLQALGLYSGLLGSSPSGAAPPLTTPARKAQAANRTALQALVRTGALTGAVNASAEVDYPNADEAAAARETLLGALDGLAESAGSDLYVKLTALRAALVRDIAARGASLPRVVTFTPTTVLPTVVIAHALHGDVESEAAIIARNNVRHPGFVPGGEPLEVLTNV